MQGQDVAVNLDAVESLAYDRGEVLRYLDEAAVARELLEAELLEALGGLGSVGTGPDETLALAVELCDITGHLDADRLATWSSVRDIVAAAELQAAEIVTAAQEEARRIRGLTPLESGSVWP